MKLIFAFALIFSSTFAWSRTVTKKSECVEIFEKNYKKKEIKLLSFYESKSLCGFKTEGSAKPEVGGLLHGNWETIISKDHKKAIIDVSYDDLGLTDDCVHRSPVDFVNHCPEGKKFETVAKYRKEEFRLTNL